jgi:hypothetical protein
MNTFHILTFASLVSLAACGMPGTPLQGQLQSTVGSCNAGNTDACDEVPDLQQQVQEERERLLTLGTIYAASQQQAPSFYVPPQPTVIYSAPPSPMQPLQPLSSYVPAATVPQVQHYQSPNMPVVLVPLDSGSTIR